MLYRRLPPPVPVSKVGVEGKASVERLVALATVGTRMPCKSEVREWKPANFALFGVAMLLGVHQSIQIYSRLVDLFEVCGRMPRRLD